MHKGNAHPCISDSAYAGEWRYHQELLKEYPSLKREDFLACIEYAAELTEEQVIPDEVVA
jgi:hypothetical protein